jgi:phosphoribosylanthranilate isomerase
MSYNTLGGRKSLVNDIHAKNPENQGFSTPGTGRTAANVVRPARRERAMTPPPLIKICGLRTFGDVDVCLEEHVEYVGLNLYPPSPRFVGWEGATKLRRRLSALTQAVAVMVRPDADELRRSAEDVGANAVQIHGADEAYLRSLQPPSVPFWLAHGVAGPQDLKHLTVLLEILHSRGVSLGAILVDAKVQGSHGGTGQSAPWPLLAPWSMITPLILAGGLSPVNVSQAIATVRPYALDVAGGVESAPGIKDAERIRAFVRAVRSSSQTKQGEESSSP